MMRQQNVHFTQYDGKMPQKVKPISFIKYYALPIYKQATQQLLSFILDSIGDEHGAINSLFNRFENEVIGLPNKGKSNIGEIVFFYPNFR